jgi:hypothetical protein
MQITTKKRRWFIEMKIILYLLGVYSVFCVFIVWSACRVASTPSTSISRKKSRRQNDDAQARDRVLIPAIGKTVPDLDGKLEEATK